MQEEPIQTIRETSRNLLFLNRRRQKEEQTDVRRSLSNLRLNQSNVTTIANKLKTKSSTSASEMKLLQNALVDDPKNIELVLNTHGALRGLVRELSGHEVSKQCAACGCLCNLSLGYSKTCCTIAKAAGAYLVAALDTLTTQLAVSCAWTLGNLAGSGSRACDIIIMQGALGKLCDVMLSSMDMQDAAVYALTHLAYVLRDDLRAEHLQKITQALSKADLSMESSQLLFILSCHNDFTAEDLPEGYLNKIVEKFTVSMATHLSTCKHDSKRSKDYKCCELVYLVRVLANFNSENVYSVLINYFVSNNLVGNIRSLVEMDEEKSMLWFLGNVHRHCSDSVFFNQLVLT